MSCLNWMPGAMPTSSKAPVAAGLVLPLLGGLPDALIVGVSAFASSREAAQEEVAVGIGALAGPNFLMFQLQAATQWLAQHGRPLPAAVSQLGLSHRCTEEVQALQPSPTPAAPGLCISALFVSCLPVPMAC